MPAQAAPRTRCFNCITSLPLFTPAVAANHAGFLRSRWLMPPGFASARQAIPARGGNCGECAPSVRERPHPEFLLANLPQPREAVRLDDQEENDEDTDHHELEMLDGRGVDRKLEVFGCDAHHDRQ